MWVSDATQWSGGILKINLRFRCYQDDYDQTYLKFFLCLNGRVGSLFDLSGVKPVSNDVLSASSFWENYAPVF